MNKRRSICVLAGVVVFIAGALVLAIVVHGFNRAAPPGTRVSVSYEPRIPFADSSRFGISASYDSPRDASAPSWKSAPRPLPSGLALVEIIDHNLTQGNLFADDRIRCLLAKAVVLASEGDPRRTYTALEEARASAEKSEKLAGKYLFTIVYIQGVTGLRIGENENCILCRGESSCILPISAAAVHRNPEGSRLAIRHFREYLRQFPDDLEIRWLPLGLAGAKRVARLEIHWPASGTTQVFHDIAADQAIEVAEFAAEYRKLKWAAIPLLK